MPERPAAPNPNWLASAARYWEPRRLLYNLLLTVTAVLWFEAHWAAIRPALHLESVLALLVLAGLANLCYTAAYAVEAVFTQPATREWWLKRRWTLWAAGMLLALLLENYWIADEILSPLITGR